MADIATVVGLLERWRDAGKLERLSVAVDATRVVRALPPEGKRELAVEVARRVAPQLVPQIEAETGDLSPEQVSAVVDLIRRADQQQLDDMITALRSGDVDPALALADEALDIVVPPPVEVADPAPADDAIDERLAVLDSVPDEADLRAEVERRADDMRERWATSSPTPTPMAPLDIDFSTSFRLTSADLPDTDVEVVPTLLERAPTPGAAGQPAISTAGVPVPAASDAASVATPDVAPTAVTPLPARATVTEEATVLDAVLAAPDGYRRRRAAVAALRTGQMLAPGTVLAVLRALERATDRAWVAGAALDAGVVGADDLAGLPLSAVAAARLRRRAQT